MTGFLGFPTPCLLTLPPCLQGEIPRISDLPAPWGDKPYTAPPAEELTSSGYLPARFPEGWSPLSDVEAAAA